METENGGKEVLVLRTLNDTAQFVGPGSYNPNDQYVASKMSPKGIIGWKKSPLEMKRDFKQANPFSKDKKPGPGSYNVQGASGKL